MRRLAAAGVAVGVLAAAVYWYARPTPVTSSPVLFEVKKGDLTVKITEPGEIRSLQSVTIVSRKDGPIATVVPEGTIVKPGDLLVRFDATQQESALAASRGEQLVAEAELRRTEKEVEAQKQKLQAELARLEGDFRLAQVELADLKKKPLAEEVSKARLEHEKAKLAFEQADRKRRLLPELAERGFITRTTLDEAEVNYLATKANLQVAQFTLEKVSSGATAEELEKATIKLTQTKSVFEKTQSSVLPTLQSLGAAIEKQKADVQKAMNRVEKAKEDLEATRLRAPQAGLVLYAKSGANEERIHPGMMTWAGQALLYLPDMSTMVADTEINEVDIGKVKHGAPVNVKLEAYPAAVFPGKVMSIGTLARPRRGRPASSSAIKVFDVTVRIEDRDPRVKPGSSATLAIIVDHQRDVISIPLSAVVSRGADSVVLVANGGKMEERRVALGPSNDERVVVREGLRPGEKVSLGPPPSGSR